MIFTAKTPSPQRILKIVDERAPVAALVRAWRPRLTPADDNHRKDAKFAKEIEDGGSRRKKRRCAHAPSRVPERAPALRRLRRPGEASSAHKTLPSMVPGFRRGSRLGLTIVN